MRISDWSSDVCSSDLPAGQIGLSISDDIMFACIGDAGRKDNGCRQVHLMCNPLRKRGFRFQDWLVILKTQDARRIFEIKQCPECAVNADLLPRDRTSVV